jgi:hypothetical protein
MTEDKPFTTEQALKDLTRDTDKAVAKAQAAMAKVTGKAPDCAETTIAQQAANSERNGSVIQ